MKIGVCQETARFWRRARHTAMLSRSWRFASMRTTSGRAAGARSRSSRPPPTDTTRYPSGSSMLSSAWLSHVPEFARSTTGERVNGMRGGNVVLSGSGYCNQCADGAPAGEPGETLAAPGEKTRGTVDARGDESRGSAYRPGLKNVPIHPRLLVTGAALTLLLASRAAGQRLVARSAPLPLLEPGQTIRV